MALIGSLNSGVSALRSFSKGMEVLGDNTANVNTIGFKTARIDYTTAFGDVLSRSTASSKGSTKGSNSTSSQIGSGVQISAISTNFAQGTLESTGKVTDLAIVGEGFYKVLDTINNKEFATRVGNFRIDDRGYVVTQRGFRLQGLTMDKDYTYIKYGVTWDSNSSKLTYTKVTLSGPITSSIGDLKAKFDWETDNSGHGKGGTLSLSQEVQNKISMGELTPLDVKTSAPALESFTFDESGNVFFQLTNGDSFTPYQLLLMNFKDKQALTHEGEGLYTGFDAAGVEIFDRDHSVPSAHGLGKIRASALELSNVDLTQQFSTIITTQRSFQAAARIISVSDDVLNEVVNLKR